ncbi:motile sperm domain-containing protein 2-like [Anthonomus grandis grandis]|uniref:motile sperm domain-containing protein 2-like n=1 Tax=Anthonomus grandis grandis TaxID=2921223 RepID=UPI002165AFC2|nr:motile sperm domain-containing protein 2-like [Anthonomus grandis grandis]
MPSKSSPVSEVPLSLVEEVRSKFLQQVQEKGQNCIHPKDYERIKQDNHWLQRFIAHKEQNVKEALDMMWNAVTWRKDFGVNDINEGTIKMDIIVRGAFFPHGVDKDGYHILIFKLKMHSKGAVDANDLKRCIVYWFERIERMSKGDIISIFFDMEGCGLSNMDMDIVKYLIGLFNDYYPFFLNNIYIYEMPWVLSAAFKIIKTWLPEKAIEKLKMIGKKDIMNYIDKDQALKCWGGNSDYVFSFVPEEPQANKSKEAPIENSSNTSFVKKVHFVDGSSMAEQTGNSDTKEEGPLAVTPQSVITFVKEGTELVSTLGLHNTDASTQIAFKLKTTSPEKFRVKPSTGFLKPGAKETITVTLLPGFQLGGLSKDKFLVISTPLEDAEVSTLDISELWKNTGNRKVYQTRLKCVQSGEVMKNGNVVQHSGTPSGESDAQLSKLSATLSHMGEHQVKLSQSLDRLQYIQVAQFLLVLVLGIIIIYILSNSPSLDRPTIPSEAYCEKPPQP